MTIKLGATYKDKITGLTGVCTGICYYLSGCNQACLTPQSVNNEYKDSRWLDFQRLDLVEGTEVIVLDNSTTPGFGETPSRSY